MATTTVNPILKIRRGLKASLKDVGDGTFLLSDGELGFCTDSKELYIGKNGKNELIGDINTVLSNKHDIGLLQNYFNDHVNENAMHVPLCGSDNLAYLTWHNGVPMWSEIAIEINTSLSPIASNAVRNAINTVETHISNVSNALNTHKTSNDHDGRYYTKSEVDTALGGKANATHNHNASNINAGTLALARIPTGTSASTVALGNHTHDIYAPIASPTLTGTPKSVTPEAGNNSTMIATTAFVQTEISNKLSAADAMVFVGTLGTNGTYTSLPNTTSVKIGWTLRVITAGTYGSYVCEIGDLVICTKAKSGSTAPEWTVAQTNIDGALTKGGTAATSQKVALFTGNNTLQPSSYTIAKSVPSSAVFTDTWKENTSSQAGYVAAPNGNNKVYISDGDGTPSWGDAIPLTALPQHDIATAHNGWNNLILDGGTF